MSGLNTATLPVQKGKSSRHTPGADKAAVYTCGTKTWEKPDMEISIGVTALRQALLFYVSPRKITQVSNHTLLWKILLLQQRTLCLGPVAQMLMDNTVY